MAFAAPRMAKAEGRRPVSKARRDVARREEGPHPHALAEWILDQAETSGEPADRVLREAFRIEKPDRALAARVAETVFAWHRWRNFTDDSRPRAARLARAAALAREFARDPTRPDDDALLAGAVPDWLASRMEVAPAFVRALQHAPNLWIRARRAHLPEVLRTVGGTARRPHPGMPEAVLHAADTDLFRTAAFARGLFEIQDIASQAVGLLCAPRPGQTWWDACAGEGGKTLHLSDLMENRGLIVASDRSARRLATLRTRAARAEAFNLRIAPWPVLERPPTRTLFHGVLVDAPCSGVGTWGRNPHARWTVTPADVDELATLQRRLLEAVAPRVRPGGRLIYAVCTLTRDETSGVADAFEAAHPAFEPEPVADPFRPEALFAPRRLWSPETTGGNGMFVAAWRRRPEN